jgi:tetratricopeptide (TPR) repeat protein
MYYLLMEFRPDLDFAMRKNAMIDRLSRGLAALVVVLLATHATPVFVPTAHAQQDQQDAETAKKVLQLIREGNTAFDEEKYETAFDKYEQAYELYPDPAILVRLGKTSEKLGNKKEAIGYYKEFARLMPDDPAAEKLAKRAEELEGELPIEVAVASEPQGAQIFLDKAMRDAVGTTPAQVELTAGEHTLYLKKKGFETAVEKVTVEAEGEQSVSVTLTRAMISEEGNGGDAVAPIDAETSNIPTYGYASLGLGVVTLATSGTFLYLKGVAEDDVNNYDKRAPGASRQALQERKDDANSYYDTALVTGIAGGVLTATGVGLLTYHYLSADAGDDEVAWGVGASFDADAAWLGVNGSF